MFTSFKLISIRSRSTLSNAKYRVIFCRISHLLRLSRCEICHKDYMANVTVDISLLPLTSIMSPRRNNLEHFTRDTRSPPVGPVHVMRGRDVIYSQDWCRRHRTGDTFELHDWCSTLTELHAA